MRFPAVLGVAVVSSLSSASVIVVDDFPLNGPGLVLSENGESSTSNPISDSRPRFRTIRLAVQTTDPTGSSRAFARVRRGSFTVSSDADVETRASLEYFYLAQLNLGRSRVFKVAFDSIEPGSSFALDLIDRDGISISRTVTYAGNLGPANLLFDMDNENFNYEQVKTVRLTNSMREGIDYQITSIQAVPEPASIAALGFGLLAVARRRKM